MGTPWFRQGIRRG